MEQLLQSSQGRHVVFFTHNEQSHITPMLVLARLLVSRGLQVTCARALPATAYASYISTNNSNNTLSCTPEPKFQVESVEESPQHSCASCNACTRPRRSSSLTLCIMPGRTKSQIAFQPGMQDEVIDFIPGLMKGFRVADIPLDFLRRIPAELEGLNFLQHSKACAGIVLYNTSYALEVEAEALDALVALGLQIYPVAPMLNMDPCNITTVLYREDDKCLSWLDRQPLGSVVYVSFGSIVSLTREEVLELALGLEACGQPFLWVIRCIEGVSDVMSVLPPGFVERINTKGLIVVWAPQVAVLSHPSVGCFIFHSGLTSLLEAIWAGVPMIGDLYKISEQNTVFRVMTEGWRVALPIIHESRPHSPLRNCIETAIKEVLRDGGAAIRLRIAPLRAALKEAVGPSGISRQYLEQLVDVLLSLAHE
ncbi:hypothetical protein GOP47_0014844 [Adiantum capillus-veneris]|uniref:Glycosyltransferase n=1 Tax=Adiantum capillus-veneris TaxID=13818 RepID=A0A9D4UN09_ADICA|nr:hypothetical protein GOP47_0014844 [Adiantum capillus-veneris]